MVAMTDISGISCIDVRLCDEKYPGKSYHHMHMTVARVRELFTLHDLRYDVIEASGSYYKIVKQATQGDTATQEVVA